MTTAAEKNKFSSNDCVSPLTYAGLFLITLVNLTYENLLTRIFSVTLYYNFAFMAISIALFGMSVGSILVYLLPGAFRRENNKQNLAVYSLLFAFSIVISFAVHTQIPFSLSSGNALLLVLNYLVISVPFVFGGMVVSLALTRFAENVSKLYAADLLGAALGCILYMVVLNLVSAPTAVAIAAALSGLGALLFALDSGQSPSGRRVRGISYAGVAVLGVFAVAQIALSGQGLAPLQLKWVKGSIEPPLLFERWNSYSRVRVWNSPLIQGKPFGWGLSHTYPADRAIPKQLYLDIDASAATVLTEFNGDFSTVDYLKYDVTNVVHYLRPDANILVIGAGGGRDVLSALLFKQRSVTGVEINENIINLVNQRFGDFTGHLDRYPGVTFVRDEARSYIARTPAKYDVIQVSLIDTWAATAAGAYVFTENSLYTTEAWGTFFDHLSPNGVISFSRWYITDLPVEMYRITSLASSALTQAGVENPRDHIIIVRYIPPESSAADTYRIGTILVSKAPFTQQDIDRIHQVAQSMGFDVVLSAQDSLDPTFGKLTDRAGYADFVKNYPLDISAPTDDRPFFFHTLRLSNFWDRSLWNQGSLGFNVVAVITLAVLLFTVVALTILCIIIPILLTTRRVKARGSAPYLMYFAMIGLGFMLVEISQMQRLTVFLGHPSYSMATALFSLLVSSGIGSYLTEKVQPVAVHRLGFPRLLLLLALLVLFGLATPLVIRAFAGSSNAARILLSVLLLSPLGLFMGMAFPLGMKAASIDHEKITPWLWGINGATSVCASVLAVAVAMSFSISTSYWTGFVCYGLAAVAFAGMVRGRRIEAA